jgi:Ca-activated chloride channel family protein
MTALRETTFPTTPAPSPQARERALSAAMESFDGRRRSRAPIGRGAAHLRPSPRRFVIRPHQAALAASLALLVGGPLTYLVAREHAAAPKLERTHPSVREGEARMPDKPAQVAEVTVPLPEPVGPAEVPAPAKHRDVTVDDLRGRALLEAVKPGSPPPDAYVPSQPGVRGDMTTSAPPPVVAEASPSASRAKNAEAARPAPIAAAPTQPSLRLDREARMRTQAPIGQMQAFHGGAGVMREPALPPSEPVGRDQFAGAKENGFRVTKENPVSTFSIDVDTASYSFARASLARNVLPRPDSVRTEEMINYFPYAYEGPASPAEPFRTHLAVFPSPWNEGRKIVRIGIKGYAHQKAERPRANLVFLVDTSGSMNAPNRLPLVKQSLAMLLDQLDGRDRVAIVTYAGSAGTALEPTPASEKAKILTVIEGLGAGGSTAGGEGIRQAYALAGRGFDKEAVNRVVLATDGDFNVGIASRDELRGFVERERGKGIFLSVLGFGMGNYNDALMQDLAQNGNGAAAYIDTLAEARKVLVEEATSTLVPIAKDVKIQVEFNPATVAEYRLVGYETRLLAREDFANDKVDAGEVGSGQSVTALYEIVPAGGARTVAELRYGESAAPVPSGGGDAKASEYGFVKIRYKLPASDTSTQIETPIARAGEAASFEAAPQEARFAVAVAGFAELLRGAKHTGRLTLDDVARVAQSAKGDDAFGYRAEFVNLARAAKTAASLAAQRR